jgi:dynein heavy chain
MSSVITLLRPLCVDPHSRANKFIRKLEKSLIVCHTADSNFQRVLETSIKTGGALLIENVSTEISTILKPVLLRQTYKSSGRIFIKIGENEIDYNQDFRLYLTTKIKIPVFSPEIYTLTTVINFSVTPEALEEQLLSEVVKLERSDLEKQRDELVVTIAEDRKQLKEMEDQILQILSTSKGNQILENETAITVLTDSRVTSEAINARLKETEDNAAKIDKIRELYRQGRFLCKKIIYALVVSTRAAMLYFMVEQLPFINPMYHYSLEYFISLFIRALEKVTTSSELLATRIQSLVYTATSFLYTNLSRGLFNKDRLIFAFSIVLQMLQQKGKIGIYHKK